MDSYHITGGKRLCGEHCLSGAKNGVLPILAATIISGNVSKIENCPSLSDVHTMTAILKQIGCDILWDGRDITVDSRGACQNEIPDHLMQGMRSSVFLMGPLLARCGKVVMCQPGGCAIGERPIDIHLSVLRKLGAEIEEMDGKLVLTGNQLKGAVIRMEFPSVGATENLMMAATQAEGETRIIHPAKEPEIEDLQNFLNSCGACVTGAGTGEIIVKGKTPLHDAVHKVIPDRIEAGTFLAAAAVTGGEILLRNAAPSQMAMTLSKFREAGCRIKVEMDRIYLEAPKRPRAVSYIKTLPYPGFPTDMQSQMLALLTIADGTSKITETIFENRFKLIDALGRMGASIQVEDRTALVHGVKELHGARVEAEDLRGGAALVLAGLAAEGETIVDSICHIERGYDNLDQALRNLGAGVERIQTR